MIKLNDFLTKITEEEYFKADRISYSKISGFLSGGPKSLLPEERKTSSGFSFGKLVDKKMFDEEFDIYDNYNVVKYIPNFKDDNAITKLLIALSANKDLCIDLDDLSAVNEFSKQIGVWSNIKKDDLRIARIACEEYFEGRKYIELSKNGKDFITEDDLKIAFTMESALLNHRNTKDIFTEDFNIEKIYQGIVFFEVNGEKCKSMLDVILVDHKAKIIYPKDLKTGSPKSFFENFNRFHYPHQAAMYSLALKKLVETTKELAGYKVAPFEFIYVSKENPTIPKVYKMEKLYIEIATGGWINANGFKHKGIFECIEEIKWHINNEVFDISQEEYFNKKLNIKSPYNFLHFHGEMIDRPIVQRARRVNLDDDIVENNGELENLL